MARSFNGTSDRIDLADETAFDFERTQPFCGFASVRVDSAVDGPIIAKQENSGTFRGWSFGVAGFNGPRLYLDLHSDDGSANFAQAETDTPFSTGVDHRVGFCYTGSSDEAGITFQIDGVQQGVAGLGGTLSATILNDLACQIGCRGGVGAPGFFLAGSVGEVALWDAELNDDECLGLGKGFSPLLIRPQSLVAYLPVLGNASPEPDIVGGHNGTLTGTTKADHPRVILPSRKAIYSGRAA